VPAIEANGPARPVRFVLMNPAGSRDRELPEPASAAERAVLAARGATSRRNVAHFMAELMTGDEGWARWRGRMPVPYDAAAGVSERS
jgi:hypothetical protein